jgi:peptidoglycan/LPS O-acetylase OafA/YrhL
VPQAASPIAGSWARPRDHRQPASIVSTRPRQYWPALDGVRAVAIIVVVIYHLGHLGGGWMGVDVFFVLSGYLITTLLLSERVTSGRIALRKFWARRAKRLLPGVLLLLLALGVYAWAGGPGVVAAQLRAPALATLFYFANWQQNAAAHNYFAAFSAPTPLIHTWSLAIEEQYYLLWPLLVVAVAAIVARARVRRTGPPVSVPAGGAPRALLWVTVVLLAFSAVAMGFTAHLVSVNRAYLGTDTRAWELLVGATAAMLVRPTESESHRRPWSVGTLVAALGLATIIGLAGATGQPSMWIWDGGLVAAAVCAGVVITGSIRAPHSPVARVLSLAPMRWVGRVSYSLYLWHWPVIDLVTPSTIGLSGVQLLAVRVGLMTAATCASYYLVERPLRRADWSDWRRRVMVPVGIGATAGVLLAATVTPTLAGTAQLTGPSGTHGTSTPTSAGPMTPKVFKSPVPVPTATDPLRVWILGDSVMHASSPGVTAALEATGRVRVVADSSIPSWGLTTATNWATDSKQIIGTSHPQIVIGTWLWDDKEAKYHPKAYAALLHHALATWLAPGDGVKLVVLLQFPQTGPNTYLDPSVQQASWTYLTSAQEDWNRIAQRTVLQFPGHAVYLSTTQLFAPGGRYLAWFKAPNGSFIRARSFDNVHMCPYGAASLGLLVVNDLSPTLRIGSPRPNWQFGAWTKDPRYNLPPGACPADQPPPDYRGLLIPGQRVTHPKKTTH